MAFPVGWGRRQLITISSTPIVENLANFTVLLTRSHFDNEVVDPSGSNASQADGGDLRFSSDSAGANQLACDVISWGHDSVTNEGDAAILVAVKTNLTAASGGQIYVWYKTAGADTQPASGDTYGRYNAYDANWVGFWPLVVNDTSNRVSATGTLDNNIGSVVLADSTFDHNLPATSFNGTQYLHTGDVFSITDYPLTASVWHYRSVTGFMNLFGTAMSTQREVFNTSDGPMGFTYSGVQTTNSDSGWESMNTWHQSVVQASPTTQYVWVDKQKGSTPTAFAFTPATRTGQAVIGTRKLLYSNPWTGDICMCQWHAALRSDAWIQADYEQLKNPTTFATAGTPSAPLSGPPVNTVAPVISKVV